MRKPAGFGLTDEQLVYVIRNVLMNKYCEPKYADKPQSEFQEELTELLKANGLSE